MQDYLIERRIPGVGQLTAEQLKGAAQTSNAALAQLGTSVEWVSSFVTANGTFCHYRAENEALIRDHACLSGFPADAITPIVGTICPATGGETC